MLGDSLNQGAETCPGNELSWAAERGALSNEQMTERATVLSAHHIVCPLAGVGGGDSGGKEGWALSRAL